MRGYVEEMKSEGGEWGRGRGKGKGGWGVSEEG